MVGRPRIELGTNRLKGECSTTELAALSGGFAWMRAAMAGAHGRRVTQGFYQNPAVRTASG